MQGVRMHHLKKSRIVGKITYYYRIFERKIQILSEFYLLLFRIFVENEIFSGILLLMAGFSPEIRISSEFAPPSTNCWVRACLNYLIILKNVIGEYF